MIDRDDVVLLTGASGMVGSAVWRLLRRRSFKRILTPSRRELDLCDRMQVDAYFAKHRPEHVFMIAAKVGGIAANRADPVGFLSENVRMEINLFEACHKYQTRKNLLMGSSCIYPRESPQPMKEEYLLSGPLEPTNEGYALAKIVGLKLAQYYYQQYGMLTVCPMASNIYGTGDHFDLQRSHVLSALVRRFVDAQDQGASSVTLWGTGTARREFIHVEDVAEALLFLMDNYNPPDIVNVGTGTDISIRDLASLIAREVGYTGEIYWDSSKPDGMPRKCLDVSRLTAMGFQARIGLEEGIRRTIAEYRQRKAEGRVIMNNEDSRKLAGVIELLLESSSRINEAKPQRYWYPLAMATYGVEEIIEAIDSLCSFRTTMWEKTREFERLFSAYQGCADAVMVNSGSSADLLLSFLLTNPRNPVLKQGDEILIPVVTWPTHVWSPMMAGLSVRFVDVDPETLNIDLDDLERKITSKTKAVFLVHLLGNPCQMDRVLDIAKAHDLLILEDCCEALGAEWDGTKVGNLGMGGTFSFFFSHHMVTMEGGMISCPDSETADQLRILRAHGWLRNVVDPDRYDLTDYDVDPRYAFVNWGFNVRPTELQAGFGLHQLQKLPLFNGRREALAASFFAFIDETPFLSRPQVHPLARPSWFALPVMVSPDAPFSRKEITDHLESKSVETRPVVTGNIARHPVARLFGEAFEGIYPGADVIHERGLYLGLSPIQDDSTMDRLLDCLQQFLNKY